MTLAKLQKRKRQNVWKRIESSKRKKMPENNCGQGSHEHGEGCADCREAKDALIKKTQEMAEAENKRRIEMAKHRDLQTKKIHHKMALEMLKRQFYCSHRKGTLSLMPEFYSKVGGGTIEE